jgi:hypothetical protein
MPESRTKGTLERGAVADVYRNSLARIPTLAGQLAYLAKLRSFDTGKYEHAGLAQLWGENEADKALKKQHARVFHQWIAATLEDRMDDLRTYFDSLGTSRKGTLDTWQKLGTYRTLIPIGVKSEERALFFSDMQAILRSLMAEVGLSWADPVA